MQYQVQYFNMNGTLQGWLVATRNRSLYDPLGFLLQYCDKR